MVSKIFALVGILLFVFVCLALPVVSINSTNENVSETRCDLVDPWLKPKSEMLSNHWDKTIGSDCGGSAAERRTGGT